MGAGEGSWSHVPDEPWRPGEHVVRVDAGPRGPGRQLARRVFDRDLTRPEDDPLEVDHVQLRFEAR